MKKLLSYPPPPNQTSPTHNHMSRVGDPLSPIFVRTLIGRRSEPRLLDVVEDNRYWFKGRSINETQRKGDEMECMQHVWSVCERFSSNGLAQQLAYLHICDTAGSYNTPTLHRHAITITRARWRNRARLWLLTPDRLDPQPCDRHWEPNVLGPGAAEATGRLRLYLRLQNTFHCNAIVSMKRVELKLWTRSQQLGRIQHFIHPNPHSFKNIPLLPFISRCIPIVCPKLISTVKFFRN